MTMRRALLLTATCFAVGLARPAHAQVLQIVHIDVEQGDATVIVSPDGHALLFDAGNEGKGRDRVVPRLIELGLTGLDYTVLSHYDADHVGGLDEVIVGGFAPRVAYDRGATLRSTQAVANYFAAAGTLRRTLLPGEIIPLGAEVTIECVAVNGVTSEATTVAASEDEENDRSIAFVVRFRDFDYFVGGDLTAGGLGTHDVESLVAPIVRDVDVLRVSHHGSPTSTGQALVDRLRPEVAIISAGYSNTYGHPDQTVLDRLTAAPLLVDVWVTNRGTATMASPKLRVVGETSADDGEVLLTTDGRTAMSINGVSHGLIADRTPPVVTAAPRVVEAASDRATVELATDELAEIYVEYGFAGGALDRSAARRTLDTTHRVRLDGLAPLTAYTFRAALIDATGNGPTWTAPVTFTTPAASGALVINEVAAAGSDQDEWIELYNASGAPVALGGWTITDNDAHTFVLPAVTLPSHAYAVITSGVGVDDVDASDGLLTLHGGGAARFGTTSVWNNDGDDVVLRGPAGELADAMIYGTGTGIDAQPASAFTLDVAAPPRPAAAQSVARYPNGTDRNLASDWARPAATTRGASNGGEPPLPPPPPVAEAGVERAAPEGAVVHLDGTASAAVAPGASLVSMTWSFGDGATASGAAVDHVFADDGDYVVTLTVVDSNGMRAVDSTVVTVTNVAPTVSLVSADEVLAGEPLALSALTADASVSDAANLDVSWSFGDGSALAYGAAVSHVFAAPGTYVVTVSAADDDGGVGNAQRTVTVLGIQTQRLRLDGIRDQSTGLEYGATSPEVAELDTAGDGGLTVVAGGATKWMEARFVGVAPRHVVTAAEVVVAHRMLSSRWSGTLRLELRAGTTLLASTTLAKVTSVTETRWDVSALVTPDNAGALTVRMVNDVPGAARVSWAYASVSVTGY